MTKGNLISPMLATLVPEPFRRAGWVFEEKYDGIRTLAYRHGKDVRLISRNAQDLTAGFPEIVSALERLPGKDFILDGEIVALDAKGVSRFQLLQHREASAPCMPSSTVSRAMASIS